MTIVEAQKVIKEVAIEKGFPCTLTIYESEGRMGGGDTCLILWQGGGCL